MIRLLFAIRICFAYAQQYKREECVDAGQISGRSLLAHRKDIGRASTKAAPSRIVTASQLISAEERFTGKGEAAHGDVGGDRMSKARHNYAEIYETHLAPVLRESTSPTLAEIGILTGSGLAMWSSLFPGSNIFGFDLNTTTYLSNREQLKSLGYDDTHVKVFKMDQRANNTRLLRTILGEKVRLDVVVDDGYHVPEAGKTTFLNMNAHLADRFVYFIEDVTKSSIEAGLWKEVSQSIMAECSGCEFLMECPPVSDKDECVAVITRL